MLVGNAKVTIDRFGDLHDLEQVLIHAYDKAPLHLVGFKLCRVSKSKQIIELSMVNNNILPSRA